MSIFSVFPEVLQRFMVFSIILKQNSTMITPSAAWKQSQERNIFSFHTWCLFHFSYICICMFVCIYLYIIGFLGGPVVKNLPVQETQETWVRPWVRKILWSRKWQPTSVFLPGIFYGQRSLGRLQSMELQRVGHDCAHIYIYISFFGSSITLFLKVSINYKKFHILVEGKSSYNYQIRVS